MFNSWFRKESPLLGWLGSGGGLAFAGGAAAKEDYAPGATATATGGETSTPGDGYKLHIYTTTGSTAQPFTISNPGANVGTYIDIFLIAGGGGGGGSTRSGAGGAGGAIYMPDYECDDGTDIDVYIGSGGAVGPYSSSNQAGAVGVDGQNSTFYSPTQGPAWPTTCLVALGGGRGGASDAGNTAYSGGCGGANWYSGPPATTSGLQAHPGNPASLPANSETYGFGGDSGTASTSPPYGSGGGGIGGDGAPAGGANPDNPIPSGGGIGKQWPQFGTANLPGYPFTPFDGKFGGGGTSADYPAHPPGGAIHNSPVAEPYGGGAGRNNLPTPGSDADCNGHNNTGGGGGSSGTGGPGLVIIRYVV